MACLSVPRSEFEDLATQLGRPIAMRRGGAVLDRLVPRTRNEAPAGSRSGTYGVDAFPFHTDAAHHRLPPRFVLLRLVDGSQSDTPTLLLDRTELPLDGSDIDLLHRERWAIERGAGGTFHSAILTATDRSPRAMLRFDLGCMKPVDGNLARGQLALRSAITKSTPIRVQWEPGLVVAWDNWRVLHSRPKVSEQDVGRRALERILVSVSEGLADGVDEPSSV